MKINITNGQILNDILKSKIDEYFIPFNEAMIQGNPTYPIFNKTFIDERVHTHQTTIKSYKEKMNEFLNIKNLLPFSSITLWFGSDPFCQMNLLTILAYFDQEHLYQDIYLNLIDEETFQIIKTYSINPNHFINIYQQVFLYHTYIDTPYHELNKAIKEYLSLKDINHPIYQYIIDHINIEENSLIQDILLKYSNYGFGDIQIKEMIYKIKNIL